MMNYQKAIDVKTYLRNGGNLLNWGLLLLDDNYHRVRTKRKGFVDVEIDFHHLIQLTSLVNSSGFIPCSLSGGRE